MLVDCWRTNVSVLGLLFPHRSDVEHAFPRLTHLYLPPEQMDPTPWNILKAFLVPTLRSIHFFSALTGAASFVTLMPKHCPALNFLGVDMSEPEKWTREISEAFEVVVSQLEHLRVYEGPALRESPSQSMSALPQLRHISLDLKHPLCREVTYPRRSLSFPALPELVLNVGGL